MNGNSGQSKYPVVIDKISSEKHLLSHQTIHARFIHLRPKNEKTFKPQKDGFWWIKTIQEICNPTTDRSYLAEPQHSDNKKATDFPR